MARTKGSANFSGTIEPLAGGALDARDIVATLADLTASGSFPYPYIGMETYVVAENKKYRLVGADPTVSANWEEVGSGSQITVDDAISGTSENPVQNKVIKTALDGKASLVDGKVPRANTVSDVVEVYSYSGQFYYDSAHTHQVSGEKDRLYIEMTTKNLYRYISEGQSHYFEEVSKSLALGETNTTAYRGDRGKTAYDDSRTNKTNIGTLSSLLTTAKNNLVAAINELFSGKQKNLTAGDSVKITTGSSSDTIDVKEMASTDMDEIVNPLPAIPPRLMQYSEEERVIGYWIDGKPIYQKVLTGTMPTVSTQGTAVIKKIAIGESIDNCISCQIMISSNGKVCPIERVMTLNSASSTTIRKSNFYVATDANSDSTMKNNVVISSSDNTWNSYSLICIIQYIKTTD